MDTAGEVQLVKAMGRIYAMTAVVWAVLVYPVEAQSVDVSGLVPVGPEAFEVMRQFFEYDAAVPLEARVVARSEQFGHRREKIVFGGSRERVPGFLAIPSAGAGPYPCILLLHGLTGSKESWWEAGRPFAQVTTRLLEAGFAVLALDAEFHGERAHAIDYETASSISGREQFVLSRDMMIRSVIDYRRALDYLSTRSEIDVDRLGVIGYSMGGIMAFNLAAMDRRVRAAVSSVAPVITVPHLPTAVHNSAPYIAQPFLMLMGTDDRQNYTRERAEWLHGLLGSETKALVFYESGHMLPPEWTREAAEWMTTHIR